MADAKILTLTTENGDPIAPRTAASAVSTASGESVEAALNRIPSSDDFATKQYVDNRGFLRVVSFDASTGTLITTTEV